MLRYEPLSYEARLLRIEKGEGPELRCKIVRVHSLEEAKYEALSYTCGSERTVRNITIISGDDYNFPVTESCYNAIKRLRRANSARTVWVDAVCINQDDISERNQQVKIMPKIFKNAERVFVYLGQGRNSSDEAMECLTGERDGFPTALKDLVKHPWFSNIWVLQEMYNAGSVKVLCRDKSVEWSLNAQLWKDRLAEEFPSGDHPRVLLIRDGSHNMPSPSRKLIDLLLESRFCESMDPRDRIFALLQMSTISSRGGLKVDYGSNVEDLYILAATQFLRHGHLDAIYSVDRRQGRDGKLPSWVTDWRTLRGCTPITKSARSSYHYSRGSFSKPEGRILKLRGRYVATVTNPSVKNLGGVFDSRNTGWDQTCMMEWCELFGEHYPDCTRAELEKILSMSLKGSLVDLFSPPRKNGRAYVQQKEGRFQDMIEARVAHPRGNEAQLQDEPHGDSITETTYTRAMEKIRSVILREIGNRKFLGLQRPETTASAQRELDEGRWRMSCRAKTKDTQKLVPSLMRAFKRSLERSVLRLLPVSPTSEEVEAVGNLARNLFKEVVRSLERDGKLSRGSSPAEEYSVPAKPTFKDAMADNTWYTRIIMTPRKHDWDDAKKISTCCKGRRLFVDNDRVGLVPGGARDSDLICAINGSRFPFLLRKKGSHYVLVGACYLVPVVPSPADSQDIEFEIR